MWWHHGDTMLGVLGVGRTDPGRDALIGLTAASTHGMGGSLGRGERGRCQPCLLVPKRLAAAEDEE